MWSSLDYGKGAKGNAQGLFLPRLQVSRGVSLASGPRVRLGPLASVGHLALHSLPTRPTLSFGSGAGVAVRPPFREWLNDVSLRRFPSKSVTALWGRNAGCKGLRGMATREATSKRTTPRGVSTDSFCPSKRTRPTGKESEHRRVSSRPFLPTLRRCPRA